MLQPRSIRLAFGIYELLWRAMTPILARHHRLREGLSQRLGQPFPEGPYDIWIQAASAGESYLAVLLLDQLGKNHPYRILVTTNTRQGKDIIDNRLKRLSVGAMRAQLSSAYFPFDRPALMKKAVASIKPRLLVLLETEIWPGLLGAMKKAGVPVIIVNGRLQVKSLQHYRLWPQFWQTMAPDRILAVSQQDADRYACLYENTRVSVMPNMKFDRIQTGHGDHGPNPLEKLIPDNKQLVVLGSIRQEEEDAIFQLIKFLLDRKPDIQIGLFPRHMHRLAYWQSKLKTSGVSYQMRSQLTTEPSAADVILWDVFGELAMAYRIAAGAFVGGTLAPVGGQNFLEPLTCGLIPTIGPSWKTFDWVGDDLFAQGLVRVAQDWKTAADSILDLLTTPHPPGRCPRSTPKLC